MKKLLRSLVKNETGQGALITVLILLALGAPLIVPLLNLMGTGLVAGRVHEVRTEELYAADAGVEDAMYWLPQLRQSEGTAGAYTNWTRTSFDINDKIVNVTIEPVGVYFKITSTATSNDGRQTTIIAYAGGLLNNAITSNGDVDLRPEGGNAPIVTGDIVLPEDGELKPPDYQPINGTVLPLTIDWPDADAINITCWAEAAVGVSLGEAIDIKNTTSIGPAYREGDLQITNTGGEANLTLNGTVYVSGNLEFKQPGEPNAYTINLNNHTIYADGRIDFPAQRCTLKGPGCIIARGYVNFQPAIVGEEFIFVMSTEDQVWFKPQGTFYGSVAGNVIVDLQAGCTLTWTEPPSDFAIVNQLRTACLRILSFEISLGLQN